MKHVRELAQQHAEAAINTLAECLKYRNERVPAATILLAYGFGKPKETVEQLNWNVDAGGIDAPQLPESLEAWLERRHSELKQIDHD